MPDDKKLAEERRRLFEQMFPAAPAATPTPAPAPAPAPVAAAPAPAPAPKPVVAPVAAAPKPVAAAPKPLAAKPKRPRAPAPKPTPVATVPAPAPLVIPIVGRAAAPQEDIFPEAGFVRGTIGEQAAEQVAKRASEEAAKIPASALEFKPADVPDADILSGDYAKESRDLLKKFYSARAAIIKKKRAEGVQATDEEIDREASSLAGGVTTMFAGGIRDAGVLGRAAARGAAGIAAIGRGLALSANEPVARTVGESVQRVSELAADPLADIRKREKFVRALDARLTGDELTATLVKRMDEDAKKFDRGSRADGYSKLVADFRTRYVKGRMQQTGNDLKLNSTNPQDIAAAREAEAAFEVEANKTLESLRVAGNPVVKGGLNVVTARTVNDAFERGTVEGLKEAASVFLPQVVATTTGKAVRVESIPMTVLRDVFAPVSVLGSALPMPGEAGGIGFNLDPTTYGQQPRRLRGDIFARVQAGQTPLVDAMENDWVRNALERGDAGDKSLAAAVLASAGAVDIATPGFEIAAAPAVGLALGKGIDAADAVAVARYGKEGGPAASGVGAFIKNQVDTVKRAREVYRTTRSDEALIKAVTDVDYLPPVQIDLRLNQVNPALAKVYRDEVLQAVERDEVLNKILTALVDEAPAAERANEFRILNSKSADDIVAALNDAATRAADDVQKAERRLVAAKEAVEQTRSLPATEEQARLLKQQEATAGRTAGELKTAKEKAAKLEALRGLDSADVDARVLGASDSAVQKMLGKEPTATPATPRVAEVIDQQEVADVFGAPVTTKEARAVAEAGSVREFLRGKGEESLTQAESAFVDDMVDALRAGPADDLVRVVEQQGQRLVKEGKRTEPYSNLEILKILDRADAASQYKRLGNLQAREQKIVEQLLKDEQEGAKIADRFISSAEAKLRLKEATDAVNEAVKNARMATQDLQRARSMKVPKAQVKAAMGRGPVPVPAPAPAPTPVVDINARVQALEDQLIALMESNGSPDEVQRVSDALSAAYAEQLGGKPRAVGETITKAADKPAFTPMFGVPATSDVKPSNVSNIANDPTAVPDAAAAQADGFENARRSLRTVFPDNPAARRQVEMRYGLDRNRIYGVTNEPWERPDIMLLERPPVTTVSDPKHLFGLARDRGLSNVERYIMGDGPAFKTQLERNFAEAMKDGTPTPERAKAIRDYLDRGMAVHDTAKREFAERVGLPFYDQYLTNMDFWGRFPALKGPGAKSFYEFLDKVAAGLPAGTRRARGENVYFRWLSFRSAPEGFDPLVARLDDLVEVRNANLAEQAGPLRQNVVLPDGTTRFADEGAVSDRFVGYVIGAEVRNGKQYIVVQPAEYVSSAGPKKVRVKGRSVLVPAEEAILSERGRVGDYTVGLGKKIDGRMSVAVYDTARPMTNAEWAALAQREQTAFKNGLAGKISYDPTYNRHVTEPMAPPKRPTATDFDISPDELNDPEGFVDILKRAPPKPQVQEVGGAGRAAAGEPPLYTGEDRPTVVKRVVINAAMNNRDNAVERLDQVRREAAAIVSQSRVPESTFDQRLKVLLDRKPKLEDELRKIRDARSVQERVVNGLVQYDDLADDAYKVAAGPRRDLAQRLADAEEAVRANIAAEDATAQTIIRETRGAAFAEREVTLQRQVQEEVRRIAASTPGIQQSFEVARGVGALASGAREMVEATIPQALRQLNRQISRMSDEAARDLQDAIALQKITDPNQRLTSAFQLLDDTNYGATWRTTQEIGNLDGRVVDSMAFAYVDDVTKFKKDFPDLADEMRAVVRTMKVDGNDIGSLNDLAYVIAGMTPQKAAGARTIATGDLQFAQAVMSQGIVNHAVSNTLGLGAFYTAEEYRAIDAWLKSGDVSTREAARGRELALAIYGSAVDTRKPISAISDINNAPAKNELLKAVSLTKAAVKEGMTEGEVAVEVLNAYDKMVNSSLYMPQTVARELDKTVGAMLFATRGGEETQKGWLASNAFWYANTNKKASVYGLFTPRQEFYTNNLVQDADQLAVAANGGLRQGLKVMIGSLLNNILVSKPLGIPLSVPLGLADAIRGVRAGTTAAGQAELIARVNNWLGLAAYGTDVSQLLRASDDVSRTHGLPFSEMRRIFLEAGGGNTLLADEVVRDLNKSFGENKVSSLFKKVFTDQTDAIGKLLTDRKRGGAFLSLFERNIEQAGGVARLSEAQLRTMARQSADDAVAALMDYSANLHPIERNLVMTVLQPFWAFDKSNTLRVARLLTKDGARVQGAIEAARSGYRFGRWTRGKQTLAQVGSFFLENHDQNGFDVDAMKADDASRAEQMRKEGRSEAEIAAEMLYPRYEQQIRLLKQSGISSRDLRLGALSLTDEHAPSMAAFMDYYVPKPPLYFEPDEFSKNRTPFSVVVADSRLRGLQLANDATNPNNRFATDSMTYLMGPEDSNLTAFNRVFAMSEAIAAGAKEAANAEGNPLLREQLAEAAVTIIGNPEGYNPIMQSVMEIVRSSYAEKDSPTLRPITLGAGVTGPVMQFLGLADKTNIPIGIEVTDTDMGSTTTNLLPGYQIPAQTAVYMRALLPQLVAALGEPKDAEDLVQIMAELTENPGNKKLLLDLDKMMIKSMAGMKNRRVFIQSRDRTAESIVTGRIARAGGFQATRTPVTQSTESIKTEELMRGQEYTGSLVDDRKYEADRSLFYTSLAGGEPVDASIAAAFAIEEGLLTKEQFISQDIKTTLDMLAANPRIRQAAKQAGQSRLDRLSPAARLGAVERAKRYAKSNKVVADDFSILRADLAERGLEPDTMSNQNIIDYYKENP